MSLEELIKAEALSLGFALCGFSSAVTPPHYEAYLQWIEAGHHAGMDYMARPNAIEARYDPAQLLPGCRTVISLAAPYPVPVSAKIPTTRAKLRMLFCELPPRPKTERTPCAKIAAN